MRRLLGTALVGLLLLPGPATALERDGVPKGVASFTNYSSEWLEKWGLENEVSKVSELSIQAIHSADADSSGEIRLDPDVQQGLKGPIREGDSVRVLFHEIIHVATLQSPFTHWTSEAQDPYFEGATDALAYELAVAWCNSKPKHLRKHKLRSVRRHVNAHGRCWGRVMVGYPSWVKTARKRAKAAEALRPKQRIQFFTDEVLWDADSVDEKLRLLEPSE